PPSQNQIPPPTLEIAFGPHRLSLQPADTIFSPFLLHSTPKQWVIQHLSPEKTLQTWHLPKTKSPLLWSWKWKGTKEKPPIQRKFFPHELGWHLIAIAPNLLQPWAEKREQKILTHRQWPSVAFPLYRVFLQYWRESSTLQKKLERKFHSQGYFRFPRITIVSLIRRGKPWLLTLDLRQNQINAVGKNAPAFRLMRSLCESTLEAAILQKNTGQHANSAIQLLLHYLKRQPSKRSLVGRLSFYQQTLQKFFQEIPPSCTVVLASPKAKLEFLHKGDHLTLKNPPSTGNWQYLRQGKKILPKDFWKVAAEIEGYLGPYQHLSPHYRPSLEIKEPQDWGYLLSHSRIFSYKKVAEKGHPPQQRLVFEMEPKYFSNRIELHYTDYWDDVQKKPIRKHGEFWIPLHVWEKINVVSWRYFHKSLESLATAGMMPRKMYQELMKKGSTTYRFIIPQKDGSWAESQDIRLFLLKKGTVPVFVNGKKRQIPVLYLGGDYLASSPLSPPNWENISPIRLPQPTLGNLPSIPLNKIIVVDNPRAPLYAPEGMHIQTAITGYVLSSTGEGIDNAKIQILGTSSQGTTFPNGFFRLPPLKVPLKEFTILVQHPHYQTFRKKIDLRLKKNLPLHLVLTPQPIQLSTKSQKPRWIRVDAKNFSKQRHLLPLPQIQQLIAQELKNHPKSFILAPTQPIPFGLGMRYGFLIFLPSQECIGVTEDGLYGAATAAGFLSKFARGAKWSAKMFAKSASIAWKIWDGIETAQNIALASETGILPLGSSNRVQIAVGLSTGFWSSWWAYSAGRLDAVGKMTFQGQTFRDAGHRYALEFARKFLANFLQRLEKAAPAYAISYRQGFKFGLKVLNKMMKEDVGAPDNPESPKNRGRDIPQLRQRMTFTTEER
ncbi:MAG: hypothetical protein D6805_10225, partial [Planctomycetota bacterium]